MAYTALEKMRTDNAERFGRDVGPMQPKLYCSAACPNDLKSAALRFLHDSCEGLLFDACREESEKTTGIFLGRSLKAGQIPYNMQMDVDRLCLEKSLETFIDSGTAEDAYAVYYCFIEMFLGRYGNSKKIVELLSEYELNGSALLMKHRDHYSHSVYVFALGLAVYECNAAFREEFRKFYRLSGDEHAAANLFLEFWGLTSLFHDIGYPFELPFEQVLSYFEVDNQERGQNSLYLAYRSVETLTALGAPAEEHFKALFGRRFETIFDVLAFDLARKLGTEYDFSEDYMRRNISEKPTAPEKFGYHMDHAVFSSARLYRELAEALGIDGVTEMHVDALSAIVLHNSLFKFKVNFYKDDDNRKPPLKAALHPLAYMLMLCDELQCWDRTAYGRNSRTELHPMSASFDFSGGSIKAVYYYDSEASDRIAEFRADYEAWEAGGEKGRPPRLKAYSDMAEKEQRFTRDIEKIVDTSIVPLSVSPSVRPADRRVKHMYLSSSSFLHLFDLSVSLFGRNKPEGTKTAQLEEQFEAQSLEYQLSGINRAKSFSRYLNAIGCFYTDRPVDFEMVSEFEPEEIALIAPMEHERWIREHSAMGWIHGDDYETLPLPENLSPEDEKRFRKDLREQLRCHRLAMDGEPTAEEVAAHFYSLDAADQDKDWKPFNSMLRILKKYDGLRIYRL